MSKENYTPNSVDQQLLEKPPREIIVKMEEARSFTQEARLPLVRFMRAVGLYDGPTDSKWIQFYRYCIILFLVGASIRRAGQISRDPSTPFISFQETLFDPNVMMTLSRFLYTSAALCTALLQFQLDRSRVAFLQMVDRTMTPEYAMVTAKRTRKPIFVILVFSFSVTFFGCTMELLYKTTIFGKDLPWMPPLIAPGYTWLIFDFIWLLVCQYSVTMVAADFFLSCTLLRYLVEDVCRHMRKNFGDAPALVKLHYLDSIQTHHHLLTRTMKKLEECYSLALFVYYSFAVPACCFMAYVGYRSSGGHSGITGGIAIWVTSVIILLLIMSIPAFQLTEDGEQIAEEAFELYQNCLRGEEDSRITTQFSILISQIQSHPITISAYNYFPLNRAMLLSMFSVIFTYFLILVQFSEGQEDKEPSKLSELQEALAICRNASILFH